ncbi:hypothetical protein [Methylobacterium sp. ID0610]|uniref:hypothetical protein n=1 Tax=Methylobacterium carpenticola TaxID=3344827 RepID=UPI0036B24A4E
MNGAEILYGLLGVTVPSVLIGTIVWRLADRTRGLQAAVDLSTEKSATAVAGIAKVEGAVTALRDELHRDYVRQDSLEKVEDRLAKRMDTLDHQVRQIPQQVVGLLNAGTGQARRSRTGQP